MPTYLDMTFCSDSCLCANFGCPRHWNDGHEKASAGLSVGFAPLKNGCNQYICDADILAKAFYLKIENENHDKD